MVKPRKKWNVVEEEEELASEDAAVANYENTRVGETLSSIL